MVVSIDIIYSDIKWGYNVNIQVFESTFNRLWEKYFIKIDNNFVANAFTNEPVLGIKQDIRSFNLGKVIKTKNIPKGKVILFQLKNISLNHIINEKI